MVSSVYINNRKISQDTSPFLIAEMSGNHNQSLERAIQIVEKAAASGADAIKLQTYTADTITIDSKNQEFRICDQDSAWNGESLHDLYTKAHTPWEWHKSIFEEARRHGLICFSSPFDETAVDFLESLDTPAYKIASFENIHLPLISKAAQTGKPLIISTGMANIGEIEQAVHCAKESGCKELILLKCTSTYPASPESTNLNTIPHMMDLFKCQVGLSDHTMGHGVAVASVALGASVIEKHFTLDRSEGGVDSTFSMEPSEFKVLSRETNRAWKALGSIQYGPTEAERKSLQFRRSIYVIKDINQGEVFTAENIGIIRPGNGGPPSLFKHLINKKSRQSLAKGTPLTYDLLF